MQIVMTEGQFTLIPIPGQEEGTRAGWYFQFTDGGVQMVAPLPYSEGRKLAEALLADVEQHSEGNAAGQQSPSPVEVASVAALHNLDAARPK